MILPCCIAFFSFLLLRYKPIPEQIRQMMEPIQSIAILGIIAGIDALAASVVYAQILSFISDAKTRKLDSYQKLIDKIYELDEFVLSHKNQDPIIDKVLDFTFHFRLLEYNDFPIVDWEERCEPFSEELQNPRSKQGDYLLRRGIAIRLLQCEQCLKEIGLTSIKLIVAPVELKPLLKILYSLSAIMIFGIASFFLSYFSSLSNLIASIPIFFATFSAVLFIELAFSLKSEFESLGNFCPDSFEKP